MSRFLETKDEHAGFRAPANPRALDDRLDAFEAEIEQLSARVQDGRIDSRPGFSTRGQVADLDGLINLNLRSMLEPIAAERRPLLASEQRTVDRGTHLKARLALIRDGLAILEGQTAANHRRFDEAPGVITSSKAAPVSLPSLGHYLEAKGNRLGSNEEGGYLVSPEVGPLLDRLRPSSIMLASGVRTVPMQSDRMELPRLGTSATVYAVNEAATVTPSNPTFQKVALDSKTFAVRALGSRQWFEDAQPDARALLTDDIFRQLAAKIDSECLQGAGTASSPLIGLFRDPHVTKTAVAADAGAGGAIALGDVINAIDRLERANATPSAIYLHPRTWGALKKLLDLQDRYQLQPDPTQDAARRLFGLPVFTSSQVSIGETRGGSADCSFAAVLDTSKCAVGLRTQSNVVFYDEYSYAASLQIQVLAYARVAFAVLDPDAVQIITHIR